MTRIGRTDGRYGPGIQGTIAIHREQKQRGPAHREQPHAPANHVVRPPTKQTTRVLQVFKINKLFFDQISSELGAAWLEWWLPRQHGSA